MAGPFAKNLYSTSNDFSPMLDAIAVTPNDGADIVPTAGGATNPTRGLLVGATGTLSVVMASGNTVSITIPATACGVILYIAVTRVRATGTTATGIVAFY